MSEELFVGLDGGQSGSRAVIADQEGRVLAIGRGPACDHITGEHGRSRNAAAIHGSISDALTLANRQADQVKSVGMSLTSAPRELNARQVFEEILGEVVSPDHTWIDHDAAGNLAGASAGAPGVVVIAGGGSISYGVNAEGAEGRSGGLGYLMGDEGSAWWIGLSALRAAAYAEDGRGPSTTLLPFVLNHYQIPTIRHLHGVIYAASFTRPQVAGIAADVAHIAANDQVAASIMNSAGEKLAAMVVATIRQIHTQHDLVDVYPTGGVFKAGPLVTEPFARDIQLAWPTATIRTPQFEPVYGALIRAYQAAGIGITESLLENLRHGVRG